MKKPFFVLLLLFFPTICSSTTAPNLEPRIKIDGIASEYAPDEWILGENARFAETASDSRWGWRNDIHGVAVTWDDKYLYVAVRCAAADSRVMSFVEFAAGGATGLTAAGPMRRNIFFHGIAPNLVASAGPSHPEAGIALVSSTSPFSYVDEEAYTSRFFQPSAGPGALELALPWELVEPDGGLLKILAVITGEEGSGVGDAAPDAAVPPDTRPSAPVSLDNAVILRVDGDGDGVPDMGVSPRDVASLVRSQTETVPGNFEFSVRTSAKTLLPDEGQTLEIKIEPEAFTSPAQLYVTCEVFSVSGRRVAVLLRDEPRVFYRGTAVQADVWDGRDSKGAVVPGGVYLINVSVGGGPGSVKKCVKKSVAVVR